MYCSNFNIVYNRYPNTIFKMRIPRLFTLPQMFVASVVGLCAGLYIYKPLLEKQIIESAKSKKEASDTENVPASTGAKEAKQS